jgi:Flp pilus assembly protein TadD
LRGNIALERHDPVAAIADLRAVLRDQPKAVPVLRALARAYLANGEPALAEESLHGAMDANAADLGVRMDLAELYAQTHRMEQAVTLLEGVVRAAPQNLTAREALVRVYIGSQDFEAARIAAEDLRTLRPEAAVGPYFAGVVAEAQHRAVDAERDFEEALKLRPTAMDALAALVRLQIASGRDAQALTRVGAVAEQDPNNAIARNILGELYIRRKTYAQAEEPLAQAIRLAPTWWLPYRNLAVAKIAAGDLSGGMNVYETGVKATNLAPALVADLALLYERQHRIDDAIREYEALHAHSPQLESAANNLAMLLVSYRSDHANLDRARDLTAAFAKSSDSAYLDTNGWVHFKRGEYDQALPVLKQAAQKAPESRVILYHLGMAQLKSGQMDQARATLESALAGGATFTGSEEARSKLAELKGRAS